MKNKLLKSTLAGIILLSSSLALNAAPPTKAEIEASERFKVARGSATNRAKVQAYYAKPRSSIFLGLGVGASVITRSADVEGLSGRQSGDMSLGLGVNWDGKLGWQQYITSKMGFRIYASYDQTWAFPGQMTTLGLKGLKREYVFIDRITGNFDCLLDLLAESSRRISVYVGVYAGWAESNQKYTHLAVSGNEQIAQTLVGNNYNSATIFGFNAGMGISFARHNRFELGVKIPLLDMESQEYYEVYGSNSTTSGKSNQLVDTSWKIPIFTFSYIVVF